MILTLAIAAVLCSAGCSSAESVIPDVPDAETADLRGSDRDAPDFETRVGIAVRRPGADGAPRTRSDDWQLIRRLDLFVFDDDGFLALDSYTRSYAYSPSVVTVCSASGDKLLVAVANHAFPDELVRTVRCYDDLREACTELTDDHPSFPVMSGETRFTAGPGEGVSVTLEPMMSTVEIHSLKCALEGIPEGKALRNVRVYLTGVGNRCALLQQEDFLPSEILNAGGLSETDLGRLAYSGMVYRYLGDGKKSGNETSYGSAVLYCYPNEAPEESPASPFTRLVVEGVLDGETRYYPIPLNRAPYVSGETGGIGRNRRYVLDLTLTHTGTGSPDDIGWFPP